MRTRSALERPDLSEHRSRSLPSPLQRWAIQVTEPPEIDEAVYDRARESFVSATVDHPDVLAVYGDSRTPTIPGISDLDLALVVTDRIDKFAELQTSVTSILREFSVVFSHNPIIIPVSVFERLSLIANNATSLDHLGGQRFKPVEPDEVALTLRFFDRLANEPYGYLIRDLCPVRSDAGRSRAPAFVARLINTIVQPVVGAATSYRPSSATLRVKKGRILSKVASLRHDRDLYVRAMGSPPNVKGEVLDRVQRYRQNYFADPVSAEECLQLLYDGLSYSYRLYSEFIDRQTIYPESHDKYYLRRTVPTIATPVWEDLSPDELLHLFYGSGMYGRVLPPRAALHTATLPHGGNLFYGTPPEPEVEAMATIEERNEIIRHYQEFVEQHCETEGFYDAFKLTHLAELLRDTTDASYPADTTPDLVIRRARDVRNLVVSKLWYRSMRQQRDYS